MNSNGGWVKRLEPLLRNNCIMWKRKRHGRKITIYLSRLLRIFIQIRIYWQVKVEPDPLGKHDNPEQHSIAVAQLAAGQHVAPDAAHVEAAAAVVVVVVVHPLELTSWQGHLPHRVLPSPHLDSHWEVQAWPWHLELQSALAL